MKKRTEARGLRAEGRGCEVHRAEGLAQPSVLKPQSSKGFTLIELIVVITVIVILIGVFLPRVWFYQEQAEKAAMEQVGGALQSALLMQYGHLLAGGRESEVQNLVTENPTHWLMQEPGNYAGEFYGMTPAAISPGNWAFDLQTRELIYVPYRTDYFVPGSDGLKWVRYRAQLKYEPLPGANARGGNNNGAQELTGLMFKPVDHYQWFVKGAK